MRVYGSLVRLRDEHRWNVLYIGLWLLINEELPDLPKPTSGIGWATVCPQNRLIVDVLEYYFASKIKIGKTPSRKVSIETLESFRFNGTCDL